MVKKFVFLVNQPRGGGVSIISLKKILNNSSFFIWPYEFFYFSLFNKASKNKKIASGKELNYFFFNEVNKKLKLFSKNKINFIKFKKELFKKSDTKFNSLKYFEHLCKTLSSSYKNNSKTPEIFITYTTARGFDWSQKFRKNIFFFKSDRDYYESLKSIRHNTLGASGFYNFFNFKGKKSIFYWLESFRIIIFNHQKKLPKNNTLTLNFENLSFNKASRKKIKDNNVNKIHKFLKVKNEYKKRNFFLEVHKKKTKNKLELSKIEKYLIKNYIYKKDISLSKFVFDLYKSLNFFILNLKKAKEKNITFKIIKILISFIIFYFSMYKKKRLFNLLLNGNPHIKFMGMWR